MKSYVTIIAVFYASILLDVISCVVVISSPMYSGRFVYYGNAQDLARMDNEQQRSGLTKSQHALMNTFRRPIDSEMPFVPRYGRDTPLNGLSGWTGSQTFLWEVPGFVTTMKFGSDAGVSKLTDGTGEPLNTSGGALNPESGP